MTNPVYLYDEAMLFSRMHRPSLTQPDAEAHMFSTSGQAASPFWLTTILHFDY